MNLPAEPDMDLQGSQFWQCLSLNLAKKSRQGGLVGRGQGITQPAF
jgi:hypothetical protein